MHNLDEKPSIHGPRNFKGTLVNVRMSVGDNNDNISIIEHKMPYGEATPLHVHKNEDEVFHVLRGTMRFEIGGKIKTVHAGEIIVAPKSIPHRFIVESLDGSHCFTIMNGQNFETMLLEMSEPAQAEFVPVNIEPTPAMINILAAACARNHIEIIGPPLGI